MKIILFDGTFKTTTFINRLAKGLAKKHQVYILGFNEKIENKLPNVSYVKLGSNQNYFRFITTSLYHKFSIQTIKYILTKNKKALQQQNLKQAIRQIQPDVIHLQWLSNIPIFQDYLKKKNYTIILSQRGYHLNVRPFVNSENFNYLQKWFPKFSGFHSVSKAIQQNSNLIYNSAKKIDEVVYSGFSIENFQYNENYKKQAVLHLLSVGRPHWKKGFDYALKACRLLKEKGIKFKYTIVGANISEELLYLTHSLNLQDCVTLLPKQPQEKVYELMQQSSVLIMSSIEEGLPNVIVEAMLLGLPVIATNCGGTSEVIEHQKTGWLVPMRSSEAIANAVLNFQNLTEKTINTIRQDARQKTEQQHNEKQMISNIEALYLKCIHATD